MASVELKNTETTVVPEVADRTPEIDADSQDVKGPDGNRRPRRKAPRYRKIPRSPVNDKENKPTRLAKGGRQRTVSASSTTSGRSQRRGSKPSRRRTTSEVSAISEVGEASPLRQLRDRVMDKHQKKGLNFLNSYIKNRMELAKFENTTIFLERCDSLQMVPKKYRLANYFVKNIKPVVRTLDHFSFAVMFELLKHNRKRSFQVSKLLAEKEERMRDIFGDELTTEVLEIAGAAYDRRFNRIRDQQTKIFESLLKEYQISDEEKAQGEERLKRIQEREKVRQERRTQKKLEAETADKDGDKVGDKDGDKVDDKVDDKAGDKVSHKGDKGDDEVAGDNDEEESESEAEPKIAPKQKSAHKGDDLKKVQPAAARGDADKKEKKTAEE